MNLAPYREALVAVVGALILFAAAGLWRPSAQPIPHCGEMPCVRSLSPSSS